MVGTALLACSVASQAAAQMQSEPIDDIPPEVPPQQPLRLEELPYDDGAGSDPLQPRQEPLVVRPEQSKKQPRLVNTLPLVSKDAPPPLLWKWRNFSTTDFVITVAGSAITLGAAIAKPRSQHSLTGPIGFDDEVRDAIKANTLATRYLFRDASDVALSLTVSWPFAVDSLITAWWYRGSREAAQEMALINLQALTITGALQGATNVLVSRERPFGAGCGEGELPANAIDCVGSVHYRSFFSGHSAFSFAGAALICVHHFENDLLGAPWDGLSCAGGYGVAAAAASFRVVSDMHYASDVLIGAAVGTLVGYSVPLLHYRTIGGDSRLRQSSSSSNGLQLRLVPSTGGVGLLGIF